MITIKNHFGTVLGIYYIIIYLVHHILHCVLGIHSSLYFGDQDKPIYSIVC